MKGFVPTPESVVDRMVDRLFAGAPPSKNSMVLDPGAGRGAFVDGLLRWCAKHHSDVPAILAVEADPAHAAYLRARFAGETAVQVVECDFLETPLPLVDYVVGNPPYVAITDLSDEERARYRRLFSTARGRFDLYILFFERSLKQMKPGSRLVFITPEKYLYVESAALLRGMLAEKDVVELNFLDEATFPGHVTYPLVTTIENRPSRHRVSIIARDGVESAREWNPGQNSWLSHIRNPDQQATGLVMADLCTRISCGVATGADSVFVRPTSELDDALKRFAHPTIAGREIVDQSLPPLKFSMLLPYDENGRLLPEAELGALGAYLNDTDRKTRLLARTCVARKPWYAFHETPPLHDILRPKLLCKDIGASPTFVMDKDGAIIPRHSVYYIVPKNEGHLSPMLEYLQSPRATEWLEQNCQRAAGGFMRVQSHVLKRLPVPMDFAPTSEQLSLDSVQTLSRSA